MAKLDWTKANRPAGKATRWDKVDYKTKTSATTKQSNNAIKLKIVNEWVREVMLIDPTVSYKEAIAAALKQYDKEIAEIRKTDVRGNTYNNYSYFQSQHKKQK